MVDIDRNAVSLTSTINGAFGSLFVSTSTGILMNNEMDDFSVPSHDMNIAPSSVNYIVPGKRPISSMAPMILHIDGKNRIVIGGGGGSKCITSVQQVLCELIDGNQKMADALWRPRFHTQWIPNHVIVEPAYKEYDINVYNKLVQVGNKVIEEEPSTSVQAIIVNQEDMLEAASDPRKLGVPAGY